MWELLVRRLGRVFRRRGSRHGTEAQNRPVPTSIEVHVVMFPPSPVESEYKRDAA